MTAEAGPNLDRLAALLGRCGCPATLHGHADLRPTEYPGGNDQLSLDRANTVWHELLGRGVAPHLIVAIEGHGTAKPIPDDLSASRRVEVTVVCA